MTTTTTPHLELKSSSAYEAAPDTPAPTPALELGKPTSCFEKTAYWLSRPVALAAFYRMRYPWLLRCVSLQNAPGHCRSFFQDIGGEQVEIRTTNGAILDAFYFSPGVFAEKQKAAFEKWQKLFAEKPHAKTGEIFEINLQGKNLAELFGLPAEILSKEPTTTLGAIACQGAGNIYEFDPQTALGYLLRGKHVLVFNYAGIFDSTGNPTWATTCESALHAGEWLKAKLKCKNEELLIHGKSMGSGPAVFVGTKMPGIDVVIDRGICSMTDAALSKLPRACCGLRPFVRYMTDHFYRYPNEELIGQIKGRVLLLDAVHDTLVLPFHAERLFNALVKSKCPPDKDKVEAFRQKYWVKVAGGHNSISGGDKEYSWYRDGKSQAALTRFIENQ